LNSVMDSTATGMEALTVIPTFRARYSEEAPKTIPSKAPTSRGTMVNSGIVWEAEIKGLCSLVVPSKLTKNFLLQGGS
jgi:hypothetical protein